MPEVSFGRRIAALFVDWIVALLTVAALTGQPAWGEGAFDGFLTLGAFFVETAIGIALLGFSLGKRVVGIRVEGPDGRPIGLPRALLRTALQCLVVPAVVQTEDKRGLHDLAAGSRVAPLRVA